MGRKIVILFNSNGVLVNEQMFPIVFYTEQFFPVNSLLFMMDYPGSGMNRGVRPGKKQTTDLAYNLYMKALTEKKSGDELWVFCQSIGMGIFTSIFNRLGHDQFPDVIVSMAGITDIHSVLHHVSRGALIGLWPSSTRSYNTKQNIRKYLPRTTRIFWALCEKDSIIDNNVVQLSAEDLRGDGFQHVYPFVIKDATHDSIYGIDFLIKVLNEIDRINVQG